MNPQFQQLLARKQVIYNFIERNFTSYDFDRGDKEDDVILGSSSRTYKDFMKQQSATVNNLDETTLIFLEQLISLMPNLQIVDKEDMAKSSASGFVFEDGKIVLFRER